MINNARSMLILLFILIFLPNYALCAEKTPEQFLKDFYSWYITMDKGSGRALKDDGIYQYVAMEKVKEVRNTPITYGRDRRDYFIKLSDFPLDMSGVGISVGEVVDMGMDTLVSYVTIICPLPGGGSTDVKIVVILRRIDGLLKIIKCIDIYPEA